MTTTTRFTKRNKLYIKLLREKVTKQNKVFPIIATGLVVISRIASNNGNSTIMRVYWGGGASMRKNQKPFSNFCFIFSVCLVPVPQDDHKIPSINDYVQSVATQLPLIKQKLKRNVKLYENNRKKNMYYK